MLCERLKIQKELIPVDKVRPPVFVVKINKTQEIGSHFFFVKQKTLKYSDFSYPQGIENCVVYAKM